MNPLFGSTANLYGPKKTSLTEITRAIEDCGFCAEEARPRNVCDDHAMWGSSTLVAINFVMLNRSKPVGIHRQGPKASPAPALTPAVATS